MQLYFCRWILEILKSDLASHLSFISFSICKDNLCSAQISFKFWASLRNQIVGLGSYRNLKELAGVKKEPVKNWRIYRRLFEKKIQKSWGQCLCIKSGSLTFMRTKVTNSKHPPWYPGGGGGGSVPVSYIHPTQPRTLKTWTEMWSVWASRLWSIGDHVVDSEMRLYECRFILEVLISGLRIPREFRFFLDLHRNPYLCSAQICKSVSVQIQGFVMFDEFVLWGFLFCVWWVADTDTGIHHSPSCWRKRDKKRWNEKSCF